MVKTLKCPYPGDSKASVLTVEAGMCLSGQLFRSLVSPAVQTMLASKAQSCWAGLYSQPQLWWASVRAALLKVSLQVDQDQPQVKCLSHLQTPAEPRCRAAPECCLYCTELDLKPQALRLFLNHTQFSHAFARHCFATVLRQTLPTQGLQFYAKRKIL